MNISEAWSLAFPHLMWVLLAASAVLCAVGFYKFVYFLSIGYGFAIAGEGIAMLILFRDSLTHQTAILMVLFILYGARLSGFLLVREIKSASYRKTLSSLTKEDEKPMPAFVKAAIWICVSLLYVSQVSPVYYRMTNGKAYETAIVYTGAAIMLIGLVIETLADLQKSRQKKSCPDMVATEGLYKIVRCPNYFGEILFWTGVFLSGVTALAGAFQWIIALIGYVCIVMIMFNGAHRLETRQLARYGSNGEYKAYADKTPIILPLIPIYHLVKQEEPKK